MYTYNRMPVWQNMKILIYSHNTKALWNRYFNDFPQVQPVKYLIYKTYVLIFYFTGKISLVYHNPFCFITQNTIPDYSNHSFENSNMYDVVVQ